MTARLETWNPRYYIVIIEENEDLIIHRMQPHFKKWGIKAFWGIDPLNPNKEKLVQIWYPKNQYDEAYMRTQVLSKYRTCPLCQVGRDKSISKLKYVKDKTYSINNKKNNKKDDTMVNFKFPGLPSMGKVKTFLKDQRGIPFVGQGIAQIPKGLISLGTTELGSKIINSLLGGVIALANEKTKKNPYVRSAAYNMFWTFADPTANQMRTMKRNWDDVVAGLRRHDFRSFQGGIIEDPAEIKRAIESLIPRMNNFFSKFGKGRGRLGSSFRRIRHVDPNELVQPEKMVSIYGSNKKGHFVDY